MFPYLLIQPSLAATLTVGSSGSYSTISAAISAAASGDVIIVASGTYGECIDTGGKDLDIVGASSGSTTLNCGGSAANALQVINGETVSFSGFTIRNSSLRGAYITSSTVDFYDTIFDTLGAAGNDGNAIYADSSTISATDSTFESNTGDYGGAIYLDASDLTLTDSTFDSNYAYNGGAIFARDSSSVTDTGGTYEYNSSYSSGGAVYSTTSVDVVLSGVDFYDNDSLYGYGGALYSTSTAPISITGAGFEANSSYYSGGAIYGYYYSDIEVTNSTFADNTATYGYGGAIHADYYVDLGVTDSDFSSNSSYYSGGAIYQYRYGDLSVDASTFDSNSTDYGHGGAIYAHPAATGTYDLLVNSSEFTDNETQYHGGAIYAYYIDNLEITTSTFEGNVTNSSYYGGALYLYYNDDVTVANNFFCNNEAYYGGAVYSYYAYGGTDDWTNNIFQENVATYYGGAIYSTSNYYNNLINNTFVGNEATYSGGDLYYYYTYTTALNNIFAYTVSGGSAYASDYYSDYYSTFSYNNWYSIGGSISGGYFSGLSTTTGSLTSAPGFSSYSLDGDCSNDDLTLASGSAMIDAGHPAYKDPDGTTADMGAYGGPGSALQDLDGDGYYGTATGLGDDCNDNDSTINPAATEYCDGVDNDCDGTIDGPTAVDAVTWYDDDDGDGYGDASASTVECSAPSGTVSNDTDCDDTDSTINPGATEVCDYADNDCDGSVDEGVTTTFFADDDGDTYGDSSTTVEDCSVPSGYVSSDTDCDDTDSSINPAATEVCDSVDNNCDGTIDEASAADASEWYDDDDGDGYGDVGSATTACNQPSGTVEDSTDCDDTDAAINPGATEICDGVDNNCDGTADEGVTTTYYLDSDSDGFGDSSTTVEDCSTPTGYTSDPGDCDDSDSTAYPNADEACDGVDNDCDTDIDEGVTTTFYLDDDGDGYGDVDLSTEACDVPSGYTAADGLFDCDDTDADINPGAAEVCDEVDNNCDDIIDADAVDAATWYVDSDGDTYGNAEVSLSECDQPDGYVSDDTDCDDEDADINPGATEDLTDNIDNDCDGEAPLDADGDGYLDTVDCDDSDPDIHPDHDDVNSDCDETNNLEGDTGGQWTGDGCGSNKSFAVFGALAMLGLTRRRRR